MPRQRSGSSNVKPVRRQSTSSQSKLPTVVQQTPKETVKPTPTPAPAAGRSTGDVFKDMAATATGVAVGSAVGHAVGAGITGAFSGRGQAARAEPAAEQTQAQRRSELVEDGPCSFEIRQFLKCSEENSDLTVCQSFNEAMQRCRQRYNL
ncbi:uncharacterized protein Dwil_GK14164 [Drosophila willistoni]|uniref:CHCH domain-containing protein n=1 Tax=Drosophila willistoni TaxID=7260 RepID=B4NH15_DROWI|nr:coiled-coil-helix-coiled-coil-helix domain-containing protein 10, mitochondrial-like [Drosophila willistoni]EDW84512.1 uncharacterized protein Dwil_GK14164 [Drosophila willistoni]